MGDFALCGERRWGAAPSTPTSLFAKSLDPKSWLLTGAFIFVSNFNIPLQYRSLNTHTYNKVKALAKADVGEAMQQRKSRG